MDIKQHITTVPNFPKPGIMFRDITSLLLDPHALLYAVEMFHNRFGDRCDVIAAVESRGFLFGAPVACRSKRKLALVRKKGMLPRETVCREYSLEYGTDALEIHKGDIGGKDRVVLVDDLIATGGTLRAAVSLVQELGAEVVGTAAVIDLPELGGSDSLRKMGIEVMTLVDFDDA